jgi:transposase
MPSTKRRSYAACSTTGACRSTTRARNAASERSSSVGKLDVLGSDTHAESAAAIFSLIASCRLHRIDPEQYLDEILRVLPYWPKDRYLELAPNRWQATREKLRADELDAPLCSFTIPAA